MKLRSIILLILSLVVLNCSKSGEISTEGNFKAIDNKVSLLMEKYDIPGVNIAILEKGNVVWEKAYGFADVERRRPMELSLPCRTESISKSVTAWGVMHLVQAGKINLDKPVNQYLKSWHFPKSKYNMNKITVRQLLSHSSGLGLGIIGIHYPPESKKPSLKKYLTENSKMINPPGKTFFYSNAGFNVLELLIEEVSGQKFNLYMKENILRPMGMNGADFSWESDFRSMPNGYTLEGNPVPPYVYPDKAAGGLIANIKDITQFLKSYMGMNESVLDSKHKKIMFSKQVDIPGYYGLVFDGYALGHFIETFDNGSIAVSHGGQGSGWMTHFHFIPETGDGIVILCNSQRSWPFFSDILSFWSESAGYGSIGMGLIFKSRNFVISFIVILMVFSLYWILNTILKLLRRECVFSIRCVSIPRNFILKVIPGILILMAIFWMASLPYFFLSSVYPVLFIWGTSKNS